MKPSKFLFLIFLISCSSSPEKPSQPRTIAPVITCDQGTGCGVVAAVGAVAAVAQAEKSDKPAVLKAGKNNILIRCRYANKGSEVSFPCGSTQVRIFSEKSDSIQMLGSGEEIIIPDLKPKKIYDIEISQRGCTPLKITHLKVGDLKEFNLTCP